ncbi:MAG: hypothetical protein A2Y67_01550 [Candidatus Buchananbacteria bacterium RBG_13_39_9]|uniref:Uncharacterized protein n=1 Tax=Candidatus Buchananbacteria bacterium RBG_13_39_9 TaxID=1797531 RepID=A0A1G1XTU6_9BACT|nr:MAG: hypothetical protein A2Y67_01550 [Candidatus Buchananbacteria bacterium RBG_13_39_9]
MGKEKVFFITTAYSTSCILLCQVLEKEVDCNITIFGSDEFEEMQKEMSDAVICMIISLEKPEDMPDLPNIYQKWRPAYPKMPMVFLIPDTCNEYDYIEDSLTSVFEDECQKFDDLVKMIRKLVD